MELSYWISRWNKGKTGFHMAGGYPGLQTHWEKLNLPPELHVLVPLCGKTEDLIWLSKHAAKVTGVEISEKAVAGFFSENGLDPKISRFADFEIYSNGNLEIWCGDFLKLPQHKLTPIDLVYDKAALVALPKTMRTAYCEYLKQLCSEKTAILLHHFEYVQREMPGPPFSVTGKEIEKHFSADFKIKQLEKTPLDIPHFQKFAKRGLKSYLIEYLLLLLPDEKK